MTTYYDDLLPLFASIVKRVLGEQALIANLFLRDATGKLTFVQREEFPPEKFAAISAEAATLHPYVSSYDDAISTPDRLLDDFLFDTNAGRIEYVEHPFFSGFVRIVERRIVGKDWLSPPSDPFPDLPPVVVFASHKGGVGRSTALAVAASNLAASNTNVLAIDLDLEAPGIGGMLLDEASEPEFGALDFFVENGLQPLTPEFFDSLIGVSPLTQGQGIIHVMPAAGRRSRRNPQNVLGKISRAYLDDTETDEPPKTFLDQTRDLLRAASSMDRYGAIFVDVRAGLNETTATAILGLGAEVLLFGVNSPQTFEGYRYLLSHLASFRPNPESDTDWRFRLKMVHAKAAANSEAWKTFRSASFELFAEQIYDLDETGTAFNFDVDDPQAPHSAWPILGDSNYFEFNPLLNHNQLNPLLYERTFGYFLEGLRDRLSVVKDKNAHP